MRKLGFSNNVSTLLSGAITDTATAITVDSVAGFPVVTAETQCKITLESDASPGIVEICLVTDITGLILTVIRAQEGTSGVAFIAGDHVELRATAWTFDGLHQTIEVEETGNTFVVGDAVYYDGANWSKAQADSLASAAIGLVEWVGPANRYRVVQNGTILGLSGLTPGSLYYLDASTPGALTTSEPTLSQPMLLAETATSGVVLSRQMVDTAVYALVGHDHDGDYAPLAHVGAGGGAHADVIAAGADGFMTGADKTKLDGIATGALAGDVVGPAVAVASNFAEYDGTTGKLLKDGGSSAATFATVGHDHNGDYAPLSHVGAGGGAHADVIAAGADGFMTGADKTKLDAVEPLADVTDTANVNSAGAVMETDFDAQTLLIATSDDTPLPVTIASSQFVGRKSTGGLGSLTAAQARTILNVEDGATADQSDAEIETAYTSQVAIVPQAEAEAGVATTNRRWTAERVGQAIAALASGGGDMFIATYDPTAVSGDAFDMDNMVEGTTTKILTDTERSKLAAIEALADVTDTANVAAAGGVMDTEFNAQTLLIAVADDTPLPVTIAASQFVGRKSTGDAGILTAAEARTVLNIEDGSTADQSDAEIETAYTSQVAIVPQAEAEAGVATTNRRWTAERVGQAIAALASGGGDMFIATYDPTAVSGDAFDMDEMVEGTTTKILTDTERTKLGGIEALAEVTNTAKVNSAGAVMETDFNAQTLLIAVANDTPLPVTIAASQFVGRKSTGDVGILTAAEARTVLNVEDGSTADQSDAEIETAYTSQVAIVPQAEAEAGVATTNRRWTAERVGQAIAALASGGGDMFVATYDPTAVAGDAFDMDEMVEGTTTKILTDTERSKLAAIEALAEVTSTAKVNSAGAVMETDFNAQTLLLAVANNTPLPVTIGASQFVGRKSTGDVGILTAAEARTVLNVEDGAKDDQSDAEIETAYTSQVAIVPQAEAEAGVATTNRRWTAERVGQAIAALSSGSGDVVGPSGGVVDNEIAVYNSTTGKIIKGSGGALLSDYAVVGHDHDGDYAPLAHVGTGGAAHANAIAAGAAGFMTGADKTKMDGIEALAEVTSTAKVNSAGAVMETDFNAQTLLIAASDNTPAPVTIAASEFVGRKSTGDLGNLTAAEARTVLNVEDGSTADQSDAEIETAYTSQVAIVPQAEAEAGVATTNRRWTAERVGQAIAALAAGSGDVVGPGSAVASNFAEYDGTTGKLLKDGGAKASDFATSGHNHDADYADIAHVGTGGGAHADVIAAGASGFMTGADKTKLNDIDTLATANPNAIDDVVDDASPQLGGDLDLNSKAVTEIFTAGENVADGDVCYLNSDGKFWKVDADAEATSKGMLALANATISADNTGKFIIMGRWTTSGLTAGGVYFLSTTPGAITTTAPSATADIVRIAGYALSTTVLFFKPGETFIEIA